MVVKTIKQQFVELIEEHRTLLIKVCNVYLNCTEDRQDLYQDIILQLWKSYPGFKGNSKVSTWMYRVAFNTAISSLRRQKLKTTNLDNTEFTIANSSQSDHEDKELLRELINSLSKVEKSLIFLYLESMTYEEIAEITGMTKSNVSVRLVRIKKKLAELYKTQKI